MNRLIEGFKESAHLAGEICGFGVGKLIRQFGLGDFLENAVQEKDDAPTICVKALAYFCKEQDPHSEVFKFAVLTIGTFLNHYHASGQKAPPQQPLRDLVSLLTKGANEDQIRKWISSYFG
jgi:hypothetical protein